MTSGRRDLSPGRPGKCCLPDSSGQTENFGKENSGLKNPERESLLIFKMQDCDKQLLQLYCELLDRDEKTREIYKQDLDASAFTPCQIKYLQLIDAKKRITSSEFAKVMHVSKPTVSQLINRFTHTDCVYKEPSSTDRRICYIQLTPKGERIARADREAREEIVKKIEERLTPEEVETLISLLIKLI